MNDDNTPAVDREALAPIIAERMRQIALQSLPSTREENARRIADAILAAGILRDADELEHEFFQALRITWRADVEMQREQAWDEGYDAGSAPNPPDKRWNNPYRRGDHD